MILTNVAAVQSDKVIIGELTDNCYHALRPNDPVTERYRVSPGKSIHAEHGLAYFVETTVDARTGMCMFDFGLDPAGTRYTFET